MMRHDDVWYKWNGSFSGKEEIIKIISIFLELLEGLMVSSLALFCSSEIGVFGFEKLIFQAIYKSELKSLLITLAS